MDTTDRPVLWRRLLAEFLGTGLLVAIVVGSGIMAQRLSPGDVGLQLLENSLATALGLTVLILIFQPISGSHINPIVTVAEAVLEPRPRRWRDAALYLPAQTLGAIGGSVLANVMFGVELSLSTTERADGGRFVGEVVAATGLVLVIFALVRTGRASIVAPTVGAYIGAAYWFTSSTSFANPAVTIGRVFTDTFAGIEPMSAAWFILAQSLGALCGLGLCALLFPTTATGRERETGP